MRDKEGIFYKKGFLLCLFIFFSNFRDPVSCCPSCPMGNTCCIIEPSATSKYSYASSKVMVGCIPGSDGVCCLDDAQTGCANGYVCNQTVNAKTCTSFHSQDPFLHTTFRYNLVSSLSIPENTLSNLHGLVLNSTKHRLAYYSSHGDVTNNSNSVFSNIEIVVIAIHGADNNADDYFYSVAVSAHLQPYYDQDKVLVVAPWFANQSRNITLVLPNAKWVPLVWDDTTDKNGIWRYGAVDTITDASSFYALDELIRCFTSPKKQMTNTTNIRFPSLRRIVVVGHSSGGQYVQRWALLSSVCSDLNHRRSSVSNRYRAVTLRVIISNPSSFCYLDKRRWVHGQFKIPTLVTKSCPYYNQWPFGLDVDNHANRNNRIYYKDDAIRNAGGTQKIIERYIGSNRDIIYLAGGQDQCNVSSFYDGNATSTSLENWQELQPWCNSNGLETTCSDEIQGNQRLERCLHFYYSLQLLQEYTINRNTKQRKIIHHLAVAEGVGHDHNLMFQSKEGIQSIFATNYGEKHSISAEI